jgi:hypothetical protein
MVITIAGHCEAAMAIEKRKCGCRNDGHQWVQLCPKHYEEYRLEHERALREHAEPDIDPLLR